MDSAKFNLDISENKWDELGCLAVKKSSDLNGKHGFLLWHEVCQATRRHDVINLMTGHNRHQFLRQRSVKSQP